MNWKNASFGYSNTSLGGGRNASPLLVSLPMTANLFGKLTGVVTFTRASAQWGQDDSGVWQNVTNGNPFFNSKGILLEPAGTNKCTCYGAIPIDSYGSTRTSGFVLVKGVKYEIITRTTLDFTTVGAANNTPGTQFVATDGTLGASDSVKDVLFGTETKTYWTGAAFQQNHTNMTLSGDTAAILSTVDDTAALLAAGLQKLCPSGKVYKLDNSAGVAATFLTINGVAGNTNNHSLSAIVRGSGSSGASAVRLSPTTASTANLSPVPAIYTRVSAANQTAGATDAVQIRVQQGETVYFTLPQLEESPFVTSPMPTAGASATRASTTIRFAPTNNTKVNNTTIYLEYTPLATITPFEALYSQQIDTDNFLELSYQGGQFSFDNQIGGVAHRSFKATTIVNGTTYKLAGRMSPNSGVDVFVGGVKGGNVNYTTDGVIATNIYIGSRANGTSAAPGYIRNLRIYRKALTDAQCVAMTT